MYPVSQAYKTAIRARTRTDSVTGVLTLKDGTVLALQPRDLISGSLTLDNQCVTGEELAFGCAYMGQAALSLRTELDRYSFYGASLVLTYALQLADGSWYTLPVGRYTLTYDSGTVETRELTAPGVLEIAMPGVQSVTVSGVPVGRYTVTETAHPDLESYYCTTAEASAAVQVPSGGVGEAVITNTYAPFLTLTVTKRVTGGMGDTRRGFAFTATVDDVPVTQASESVTVSGGAALTAEGFTIPHRGSVTIGRLRPGQRVAVTEAALADYETSIDDGNAVTLGTSYAGTMGAENTALTVVNNTDGVPPTGLHVDRAPGWLVLAALACLALTCRRRRRTP